MSNIIRAALPGYNALTDTNLDHFSLYTDVDNVLIKRKLTGNASIADGSPTIQTIPHNLGYIPFFLVYYYDEVNSVYVLLNNQYNQFSTPQQIAAADITNLYIYNFGGHSSGQLQVYYEIFYDNMSDNTAPSITESKNVLKVARPGKSAFSTNPNDFIIHSDLNNFKILGSNKKTSVSISNGGLFSPTSVAHGITNIQTPVKFLCFVKFADGKTTLLGNAPLLSYDESKGSLSCSADLTNIYFYNTGSSSITVDIYYLFYGTGKDNTLISIDPKIAVATTGKNVLIETNPDNFNFHSAYPTLKYFSSNSYDMGSISATTVHTISHNLGYVPFFIGFINDLNGFISNSYAQMPYYMSKSSIPSPNKNIGGWIYADSTNIYLKVWYDIHESDIVHPIFYYKIFKNNLGL